MPRLVDREARRAELLAATWRVVRARGVEGTTTRAIADEAGCSLSVLAHFLGGKDDILVAAQQAVYERIVERAFRLGGDRYGLAALRAALDAVLPLDPERAADAHVNVAFAGAALSHPRLAESRRRSHRAIRGHLHNCLREARERDELRTGVTDEAVIDDFIILVEGSTLLSLVDGWAEEGRAERLTRLADDFVSQLRRPAGDR
ncbi:TetR/AcrR family transcriptional regulator [Actinoplanes teichomyceticus]|uniref:TetR family transcriptional regulator n=1 Tax=Actinoplanes teichomyceticus TaxID=1867 RepID=A0A561WSE4_ACTTI|nr:TetR/AcrR family transcriptional regulator [Actinoplanes teichomyceticus]TWG26782.1 TetR family transcriptional regulator [Actinoplanes teichomyceticus]GIF15180.1 HTH-type transcriptional regulator PksA [Actinoplanes teichomyceticus]